MSEFKGNPNDSKFTPSPNTVEGKCPSEAILVSLLDESIDDEISAEVDTHVSQCNDCMKKLAKLSQSGDTVSIMNVDHSTDVSDWNQDRIARIAEIAECRLLSEPTVPVIPGYEIESIVARGGMGIVFKAKQLQANRNVAIKMILRGNFAHPEEVRRFLNEAQAAAQLDHPNIVPIYDVGTHQGQQYFSMKFIDGTSLKEKLHAGPLENREAATIILRVSRAIEHGHQHGILHRDLKPANVMLDDENWPYVADFGLAKQLASNAEHSEITSTGQILGSPSFMSPEQATGSNAAVDEATDIYSLGATLYNTLTGRPPFQAATVLDTMQQVLSDPPIDLCKLNRAVDLDLETICLKCLQKEPSNRYRNVNALQQELQRYLDGKPILARPVSRVERTFRWCRRNPLTSTLIAGILTSLILGITTATYFAVLATRKAEQASEQTTLALATIETIIDTVQRKLRYIPGARGIRRELLVNTLSDLEAITEDPQFQSRANHDTAKIMVDLGALYLEVGDKGGGNAKVQAVRHLRRAVEIFDDISPNGSSKDPAVLLDQARALTELGNVLFYQDQLPAAESCIQQALEISRRLVMIDPENLEFQDRLARTLWTLAECLFQQQRLALAMERAEEALEVAQWVERKETIESSLSRVHACQVMIGDIAQQDGDHETAIEYYRTSLATAEDYLQNFPNTALAYDYLSLSYECLADYWRQAGELEKAKAYGMQMLESLQQAIQIDDEDRSYKEGLACAYDNLFGIHRELGDLATARSFQQKRDELDAWLAEPRE